MSLRLSVMEVRNGLRCPRLVVLGRQGGQEVAFPVGASALGALFQRIIVRFAREALTPPREFVALEAGVPAEVIEGELVPWLLDGLVTELEAHPSVATMPGEVDDLAEALRGLAGYLAGLLAGTSRAPADALAEVWRSVEQKVECVLTGPGGVEVLVVGPMEGVLARGPSEMEVVEYKLTEGTHAVLDREQAALYRHLLVKGRGSQAESAVLRFQPALEVTRVSSEEGDALVAQRLLPLLGALGGWVEKPMSAPPPVRTDLCASCPVRAPCVETFREHLECRDGPLSSGTRPRPEPGGRGLVIDELRGRAAGPSAPSVGQAVGDAAGQAEGEELAAAIGEQLKRQGVPVSVARKIVGPSLLRIEVKSPRVPLARLDAAARDVEHHLAERTVMFIKEGAKRFFDAPRKKPRQVELGELLGRRAEWLRERPGRFVVGESVEGEVVCGDLGDGGTAHLLIGGQTGSGKSVLLRGLIASLVHFQPPEKLRLTLVDPKRVTFGPQLASLSSHLVGPVVSDLDQVLPLLEDLVTEMEVRYQLFADAKVQQIDDYNQGAGPLARQVVVVDEFQDLLFNRTSQQAFLGAVQRLGAKARAAGIHLILATQRPDAKTVPGQIKNNMGGRIALKVLSPINSRIILEEAGAERLLGRGDLLANLGQGLVRAQAPMA
jgi:S-DNA-T family DNA segregation ATPase FtsK/SpoIIIE